MCHRAENQKRDVKSYLNYFKLDRFYAQRKLRHMEHKNSGNIILAFSINYIRMTHDFASN